MISTRPQCLDCKHFILNDNVFICTAFPGGIPDVIANGIDDHTEPFPGDNGIRFEPIDERDESD